MTNWSIWKMNTKERKYLDKSILKPYLIHVEFEIENILAKVKTDSFLRSIYAKSGFSIIQLENDLKQAIHKIQKLQSIFNPNNI